jgi:hypothetical protein
MQLLEQTLDRIGLGTGQALAIALACIGFLAVVGWLRRRRRPHPVERRQEDLAIDVSQLGSAGPPQDGPALELYHMPMRLAAIVIAPTGRGSDPPDEDRLPAIADQLVPGFGAVLAAHAPAVRIWPAQLSSQGFANTFFAQARLPGSEGKSTPWCALAGRFEADGQKFLAGLVLRGSAANNLSHVVVERESQWMDLMRVRLKRDS